MLPSFSDIKFALLYFKADKMICIYETKTIIDWKEEAYEKLKKGENFTLDREYANIRYKVS